MGIKDKAAEGIRQVKEEGKVLSGEKSKDKRYESTKGCSDEASARIEFARSKEKLFNVNAWTDIPGIANSRFQLFSKDGQPIQRTKVQIDDFIKIDLPGPVPSYWVKVNEISEGEDEAQFTVQPAYNPTEQDDRTVTDHFFQDRARSIFRVERHGSEIVAMEIGINEAINNQEGEAGSKALINTLVSEGGWALFQKHQWKNLTEYLVGMKDGNESNA